MVSGSTMIVRRFRLAAAGIDKEEIGQTVLLSYERNKELLKLILTAVWVEPRILYQISEEQVKAIVEVNLKEEITRKTFEEHQIFNCGIPQATGRFKREFPDNRETKNLLKSGAMTQWLFNRHRSIDARRSARQF